MSRNERTGTPPENFRQLCNENCSDTSPTPSQCHSPPPPSRHRSIGGLAVSGLRCKERKEGIQKDESSRFTTACQSYHLTRPFASPSSLLHLDKAHRDIVLLDKRLVAVSVGLAQPEWLGDAGASMVLDQPEQSDAGVLVARWLWNNSLVYNDQCRLNRIDSHSLLPTSHFPSQFSRKHVSFRF